jgi:type IV secretion system protein VirB4
MKATGENASSFAPIFAPELGCCDVLTTLITREYTPYGLSLHHQDVGHFILTGATGSGKTFTAKYLLFCSRKKKAQIFVFDLKTSYESLALGFGGSVVRLGYGSEPRMNPFRLDDPKFVKLFVRSLLECGKAAPLDDDDQKAVSDGVDLLYESKFPAEKRRLSMLSLPGKLHRRLEKWLIGGEHGSLFDNHSDDLEVSGFQVFSFPALAEGAAIPEELEPLLLYVFHRVSAAVHYGDRSQWKVCLLDEAWRLLQSAAVKNYVIGAVKTWREYNGSLGLATQSSGDFDSAVLQAVVENAGSLLFLANPRMNRAEYERIFHLTPRETELIAGLQPKSEILVKRLDHTKVVRLVVSTEPARNTPEKRQELTEVVKEKELASK